ncbi:toll/interleukin-1 receptor domain-containing protein [Aquabacterium humicola]|uniref:toll/interleukin-1 receptor domain-containing protein n=1 Tax=Aquabacterium humicola TaxID=3237377 RepID=UPI002543AC33|nr:toll/interleukin-1 receptor domain-containing protein [Rubrivivax pictus]
MHDPGTSDLEPAVVSAAEIPPVNVRQALAALARTRGASARAEALVGMAFYADAKTIDAVLDAVAALRDPVWRVRTLFSAMQQMRPDFLRKLPASARSRVVAIVTSITRERLRAAALMELPLDLPPVLERELRAIGAAMRDPALRIEVALRRSADRTQRAQRALVADVLAAPPRKRAAALLALAPGLDGDALEAAFRAAQAMPTSDAAALALARLASRWSERAAQAQRDVRDRAAAVTDPRVRFDLLASVDALDRSERAAIANELFGLSAAFENDALRCRALLTVGGLADEAALRESASKAGISAAACVVDARERAELLLLLQPYVARLGAEVRIELTQAVERLPDDSFKQRLRTLLGRFFVYERGHTEVEDERWDLFVSHSSADAAFVSSLEDQLASRGLRVFVSGRDLDEHVGSLGWAEALYAAIKSTRAMLVVATPQALLSGWVREEWTAFYRRIVERRRGALFTVRLGVDMHALPEILRGRQVLEILEGRPLEGDLLNRILALVRGANAANVN